MVQLPLRSISWRAIASQRSKRSGVCSQVRVSSRMALSRSVAAESSMVVPPDSTESPYQTGVLGLEFAASRNCSRTEAAWGFSGWASAARFARRTASLTRP